MANYNLVISGVYEYHGDIYFNIDPSSVFPSGYYDNGSITKVVIQSSTRDITEQFISDGPSYTITDIYPSNSLSYNEHYISLSMWQREALESANIMSFKITVYVLFNSTYASSDDVLLSASKICGYESLIEPEPYINYIKQTSNDIAEIELVYDIWDYWVERQVYVVINAENPQTGSIIQDIARSNKVILYTEPSVEVTNVKLNVEQLRSMFPDCDNITLHTELYNASTGRKIDCQPRKCKFRLFNPISVYPDGTRHRVPNIYVYPHGYRHKVKSVYRMTNGSWEMI